jgi:dihydrofolate reductase
VSVRIALVAAVAENGVIGANSGLPWRLSSDLKTFRRLTMGKPVVMGRRTFQSLKKPLDGRDNVVVSRDPQYRPEGATVVGSLGEAMILARALARTGGSDEVMVIGGADIFTAALPLASRIYLTRVHAQPEGDVRFPEVDWSQWREVSAETLPKGERDDHAATLRVYDRSDP